MIQNQSNHRQQYQRLNFGRSMSRISYTINYIQNEQKYEVTIENDRDNNRYALYDMIHDAINQLNINQQLSLDDNAQHYQLFISGKNGYPKKDLPCLDISQKLNTYDQMKFSLIKIALPLIQQQNQNIERGIQCSWFCLNNN